MSKETKMRVLPPVAFFALCGIAYVLFWKLQTTNDGPFDSWLALIFSAGCFVVAVYILLRTVEWRTQILGSMGMFVGAGIFYGTVGVNRMGWADVTTEVTLDALRAFASVGLAVALVGIGFFEWARARGRVEESEPVIDPNRIYDRRSGSDRRAGWGRLPDDGG
jgi:hypothetical protein